MVYSTGRTFIKRGRVTKNNKFFCPASKTLKQLPHVLQYVHVHLECYYNHFLNDYRANSMRDKEELFWRQGDFGYVKDVADSLKTLCKPKNKAKKMIKYAHATYYTSNIYMSPSLPPSLPLSRTIQVSFVLLICDSAMPRIFI